MASINEQTLWEAAVYLLDSNDFAEGGVNGVMNLQARQLANRTAWLKAQLGQAYVENKTGSVAGCTLAHTPVNDAAVEVYINRVPAFQGIDYTIAGKDITFTQAVEAADEIIVRYRGN